MSGQPHIDLTALRGTIAVVTGAGNNGIGWGICKHAAGELGMHVVAVDLHETLTRSAEQRLREQFPEVRCFGIQADVTRPEDLASCLTRIQQELPGIPIGAVFANAGVIFNHTILKSTLQEWSTTLNVNVIGVVNTLMTFAPLLREQRTPAILCTTASIGGLVRGDGGGGAYQASKHAVVALTESLSFELARSAPAIRVHVLCPCIVESALPRTSVINAAAQSGDTEPVLPSDPQSNGLSMTTERHAQQVFDQIAAGNFYLITDNVRPYVDHDHPFGGLDLIRERMDNLLQQKIDNSDALDEHRVGVRSAILKGPMFKELARRQGSGPNR